MLCFFLWISYYNNDRNSKIVGELEIISVKVGRFVQLSFVGSETTSNVVYVWHKASAKHIGLYHKEL